MSGVFFIVWDIASRSKSEVLRTTVGGYPHLTFMYTGNVYAEKELDDAVAYLWPRFVRQELRLVDCSVNSFLKEKTGKMRHDVLLHVDSDFSQRIDRERNRFVKKGVVMLFPHVTHGCYETKEEAEEALQKVKSLLPIKVRISGITINPRSK